MRRAEPAMVSRYAAAVPRVALPVERSAVMMALYLTALAGIPDASAQLRAALTGPEHRRALPESEVERRCHPRR